MTNIRFGLSFIFAGSASILSGAGAASAAGLDLGAAKDYAVVALGSGKTFAMNSGPLTGNALAGNSVAVQFSGGGNGQIIGALYRDPTATVSGNLQVPATISLISSTVTSQALADANAVSLFAESLAPTQNFGALNSTTTITGNGGLNVISLASLQNATVTLSGGANDFFVFNVAGNFNTNHAFNLSGGVTPSHVLFNLLGTSGNIFQTSGGDSLVGTFLATRGGNFQFSNLLLNGALINTAGNIQLVSGSSLTFTPFIIPTPGAAALLGLGGLVVAAGRRRRV